MAIDVIPTEPRKAQNVRLWLHSASQLLEALWLFTRSDLKTILVPTAVFAVIYTASQPVDGTSIIYENGWQLVSRTPLTVLWIWINLLPFTISNQSHPDSVEEDCQNKPWRPFPSKRISLGSATKLAVFFYFSAIIFSLLNGGSTQCVGLIILGTWYNRFGGADRSFLVRNLINSGGYMCFLSGSLEVMLRTSIYRLDWDTLRWVLTLGAVIFSSIHAQDIPDQAGDSARNRRTLPLVVGDSAARWTVAGSVIFWSYCCPLLWRVKHVWRLVFMILGGIAPGTFLIRRAAEADRVSFWIYNLWIVTLYLLPLSRL